MISRLRKEIDQVDIQLIGLLKRREKLILRIKKIKQKKGLPRRDLKREKEILKRAGRFKKVFKEILK